MMRATIAAIVLAATLGFAANGFAAEPNAECPAYVPKTSPSLLDLSCGDVAETYDDDEPLRDSVGVGGGYAVGGATRSGSVGSSFSSRRPRTQSVSGYVRRNGTVVNSYVRSSRR